MLRRIAGSDDVSALRTLADVVEPVKNYDRAEQEQEATSVMPLNRLVDAARPESQTGREFSGMVDAILAGKASVETNEHVRSLLVMWRDNRNQLQRFEAESFLMKDVAPLSQNLTGLATVGLQALDFLRSGRAAPESWANNAQALAEEAKKPQSQVLLTVAPDIERLIRAAGGTGIAGSPK
jgi:hexosaminidase